MPARLIPLISRAEMEAARDAILDRPGSPYRRGDLERAAETPLELAQFIAEQHAGSPESTISADILDALTLLTYARRVVPALPAHLDSLELRLLEAGQSRYPALTLRMLGERVGLSTRQATRERIRWLAHAENLRRHPEDRDLPRQSGWSADQEAQWVRQHGEQFRVLAVRLADARDQADSDLADELEQLGQTAAGINSPPTGFHDRKRLSILAARLRALVIPELLAAEHQEFRESLGPLVETLVALADQHQGVTWGR